MHRLPCNMSLNCSLGGWDLNSELLSLYVSCQNSAAFSDPPAPCSTVTHRLESRSVNTNGNPSKVPLGREQGHSNPSPPIFLTSKKRVPRFLKQPVMRSRMILILYAKCPAPRCGLLGTKTQISFGFLRAVCLLSAFSFHFLWCD